MSGLSPVGKIFRYEFGVNNLILLEPFFNALRADSVDHDGNNSLLERAVYWVTGYQLPNSSMLYLWYPRYRASTVAGAFHLISIG
jgi:hypothetical protein